MFGMEMEIPFLSQHGICFPHENWVKFIFRFVYIFQWLGTANAFDESSVYFPRLGCHHM